MARRFRAKAKATESRRRRARDREACPDRRPVGPRLDRSLTMSCDLAQRNMAPHQLPGVAGGPQMTPAAAISSSRGARSRRRTSAAGRLPSGSSTRRRMRATSVGGAQTTGDATREIKLDQLADVIRRALASRRGLVGNEIAPLTSGAGQLVGASARLLNDRDRHNGRSPCA